MFVVMNRIGVNEEWKDAFIDRFKDRAALVDNMPGFVSFRLLRPAKEGDPFVVETYWETKADFEHWTQSEEFKKGHSQAGQLPREAFTGHPKLEYFDVIQQAERGQVFEAAV
ncbi:MAG: antibiotic biosynthesis monooxygenase [Chloroflexota bacterium]